MHLSQGSSWLNEILFNITPIKDIGELSSYYCTKNRYEELRQQNKKETILVSPIENHRIYPHVNCPAGPIDHPVLSTVKLPKKTVDSVSFPEDPLFWCIFIFQYGEGEYSQITKYANRRLEENKKIGDYFKTNPKNLKTSNQPVTNGLIQEIISDCYTTKDTTSPIQLIAMAIYYKIHIVLRKLDGVSFISFHGDFQEEEKEKKKDSETTCMIEEYVKHNKRMSYRISRENSPIDELYQWHTWNQPLRGQSAYKLMDLQTIAHKLKVDSMGLKKGDLYDKITEIFQ